jgi:hypothetical protein
MHGEVQMAFGSFTKGTILRHKARCHLHLREWQAAADASWSAMDYDHLDESSDTWATTTQLCFLKATMHLGTHVALEKASDLRFDHFDDWEIPRDNEKSTKRLRAVVRLHGQVKATLKEARERDGRIVRTSVTGHPWVPGHAFRYIYETKN